MLRFAIVKDGAGIPLGFEVSGHAGRDSKGSNLACAGASALVQGLIAGLKEELGLDLRLERAQDGFLSCRIVSSLNAGVSKEVDLLFRVFGRGLRALEAMDRTKKTVVKLEERREMIKE